MKPDFLTTLCYRQGYVPTEKCQLPGQLIMLMVRDGKAPCTGCNMNEICGRKHKISEQEARDE